MLKIINQNYNQLLKKKSLAALNKIKDFLTDKNDNFLSIIFLIIEDN